ncbi:MAG: acetyl-CoA synthetase, partial [Bacillariaceae sp.]|jgi:acetyl-CoA synthetase
VSSTMIQDNVPAMFSSPVLGSKFFLQDTEDKLVDGSAFEEGMDGSNNGELVIAPPSVGLSTTILNKDHFSVYFEGMPCGPDGELLRRHGDEVEFVRSSIHLSKDNHNSTTPYFRALGRSDDTMNIGGEENWSLHEDN